MPSQACDVLPALLATLLCPHLEGLQSPQSVELGGLLAWGAGAAGRKWFDLALQRRFWHQPRQ